MINPVLISVLKAVPPTDTDVIFAFLLQPPCAYFCKGCTRSELQAFFL